MIILKHGRPARKCIGAFTSREQLPILLCMVNIKDLNYLGTGAHGGQHELG